jgi:calcineurin-like phosphoesterase family protein
MIYFTSDLHFGHNNIIKYCNRPFKSTEEMDETIIERWNKTVRAKDTCYILGDVFMYNTEHNIKCLERLHGHIYLVRGNHDPFRDNDSHFGWIKDYFKLRMDHRKFILCHFPILSWDGMERGISYHLHGHQHNPASYNEEQRYRGIKRYDVGVDANNFTPISIEEIVAFFDKKIDDKPAVPDVCPYCAIPTKIYMDGNGQFFGQCMCQRVLLKGNSFEGATLDWNEKASEMRREIQHESSNSLRM